MEIDCLPRPSFQEYQLPSEQRQIRAQPQAVQVVELISDRLARIPPLRLARVIYRITEQDHLALKRALLSSVRIRKRIARD
jgi:hypothetical protein